MNCPRCKTEIDEHEAGRETDVCVAEAVFDLTVHGSAFGNYYVTVKGKVLCYSTDIAAAWEVVERRGIWTIKYVNIDSTALKAGNWQTFVQYLTENTKTTAYGDTVPLAICRAALKAVGNE